MGKTTKIVKVHHLSYELKHQVKGYYFKTKENVKVGDYVYCDTKYGLAIGEVRKVYKTIGEIIDLYELPKLQELKCCITTLKPVDEGKDVDLPF